MKPHKSEQELIRIVESLQNDVNVLQIKVAALESLLLDENLREKYTQLVNEQADVLMRERRTKGL